MPVGVVKYKQIIKGNALNKIACHAKIFFSLTGEADNNVRCNADVRSNNAKFINKLSVMVLCVASVHCLENTIRAGLQGQVNMLTQFFKFSERSNKLIRQVAWIRGNKTQPLKAA